MTKKDLHTRLVQHRSCARLGKKSPLYDCMRKYGVDNFLICVRDEYETKEECQQSEKDWITFARKEGWSLLNLANGGEGGYVIPEASKEEWKAKLSVARQGHKPALGMKHTEENKKFFAECNKRKVLIYPSTITNLSFKEAKDQYGISKTHYYRLLKRTKSNVLS
jgi:hypothetical protein